MAELLSEPIENLIRDQSCEQFAEQCDVLIVGSGYGGAIAAMKLATEGDARRIYVFERGKEYVPGDFPESLGDLPAHVQILRKDRTLPIGYPDALFDFRLTDGVSVLVGSGVGGGSLINANVAMEPDDAVFQRSEWPTDLQKDMPTLRKSFAEVRTLLGVETYGPWTTKGTALRQFATAIKEPCHPAPVTVTMESRRNVAGLFQPACIGCGNCVTGCNTGSKNTLAMNALPLARQHGARIFTGATVLSVEPQGGAQPHSDGSEGWTVRFRRTAVDKTVLRSEAFCLRASIVILAAGTLGSTEILMRSTKRGLRLSPHLGKRFSTNGDVIAFGYAQAREVNAVACPDPSLPPGPLEDRAIGPTITGYVNANSAGSRITIEDGAVPSALAQLFGEMAAIASLAKHSADTKVPAWFRLHDEADRLAVHPGALQHSQVLLGMADDGSPWELELDGLESRGADPTEWDGRRIHVRVSPGNEPKVFQAIDCLLTRAETDGGFDGGDYLPNPLWRLLPQSLSDVSRLPDPGGRLLTVHPLGGCSMGHDVGSGVVDHYGRVFRAEGAKQMLYRGLYVMDGSIMPCALGVNPFLTIAALAHRNVQEVERHLKERSGASARPSTKAPTGVAARMAPRPLSGQVRGPQELQPVKATFNEHMVGQLVRPRVPGWFVRVVGNSRATQLNTPQALVLAVKVDVEDVHAWVREPNRGLTAHARLFANEGPTDPVRDEYLCELATGSGHVTLLGLEHLRWWRPIRWLPLAWHMLSAILAFVVRRGTDLLQGLSGLSARRGLLQAGCDFLGVARNHANWRYLAYDFTFTTSTGRFRIEGVKQLAYGLGKKDPWTALSELPLTVRGPRWWQSIPGVVRVDLVRLTQRAPFQIVRAAHTPLALAAMASAGMLLLRVLFQTHFWSFRAPDYPTVTPVRDRIPGPIQVSTHRWIEPNPTALRVPTAPNNPTPIELRLLRYQPLATPRGSILLLHGLAHSSLVFAVRTIDENLVTYLCRQGYDVWLFDYRLSIAWTEAHQGALPEQQWTMDQIAACDMPAAVRHIYTQTGAPIQIFAHCIGAGSIAMAVLSGRCQDPTTGGSMISALALHAVYPWVVASPVNQVKANVAAFLRDAIERPTLDAVLPVHPSATDVLIDRLAGSLPWSPAREALRHRFGTDDRVGRHICDRMTFFYGEEWKHRNLHGATHRELADLVGIGNIETFRQIYFLLQRRRLVDREGANRYVTAANLGRYWTFPTLFLHGRENELYRPESALASAIRLRALRRQGGMRKLSPDDVYWREIPGYGHMDMLFGQQASRDVYPTLDAFFRHVGGDTPQASSPRLRLAWDALVEATGRLDQEARRDPHWNRRPKTPVCGPIIGHVRRQEQRIVLRVWIEPYLYAAIPAHGTVSSPSGVEVQPVPLPNPKGRFYPGTYWIYDIALPLDFDADLRLVLDYRDDKPDIVLRIEAVAPCHDPLPTAQLHDGRHGATLPLSRTPWFRRYQQPTQTPQGTAFLVGSCRYPGSPFDEDLADRIFEAMGTHVPDREGCPGVDQILLVGDQIYADATADLFDTRDLRDRFARRYREAYTAPRLRRLLASVPVHMALDDHEFGDNWPGKIAGRPKNPEEQRYMQNFRHGFAAAKAYQWSMSARTGWPSGLWYSFESGGLPFFVMDTRTERDVRRADMNPTQAQLVSRRQRDALLAWLSAAPADAPKFIVSGSVLAPIMRRERHHASTWRNLEGWAGYPATWRCVVDHIVNENIQHVIFLAGDYHLSAVASLTLQAGRSRVRAYQIIASGLFAPLPFANPKANAFDWGFSQTLPGSDAHLAVDVCPYLLSTSISQFLRVEVRPGPSGWTVGVTLCDGQANETTASVPIGKVGAPFINQGTDTVQWLLTHDRPSLSMGQPAVVQAGPGS